MFASPASNSKDDAAYAFGSERGKEKAENELQRWVAWSWKKDEYESRDEYDSEDGNVIGEGEVSSNDIGGGIINVATSANATMDVSRFEIVPNPALG